MARGFIALLWGVTPPVPAMAGTGSMPGTGSHGRAICSRARAAMKGLSKKVEFLQQPEE